MIINVLGINGSPRLGNSQYLLDHALENASEVDRENVKIDTYSMKGKTMNPCIACSHCVKHHGDCVHDDDFAELNDLWLKSDVILYSVPVYHMSIPGQLKCFIDRLGNSMFGRFKSEMPENMDTLPKQLKVVGTIVQGIHLFSGQEHTITDLINHALIMQCIPVTGDLWESYIGAAGWTSNRIERNSLEELVKKGDMDSEAAVRAARAVGKRSVEMSLIIQSGVLANEKLLGNDRLYKPLLDRLKDKG